MKRTQLAQALSIALLASSSALAQDRAVTGERIEITGSHIKRAQEEGALPLQVITKEQMDRAGIFSTEELMTFISANGNGFNNLQSKTLIVGATDVENRNSTSNSSADLRGLGANSTLVLLNGRRVALHSIKSAAVDLNSIPFAAVERVEILKDGASAIYGTDAIGGVINFILRKDYRGAEVSALADVTQDGGGNRYRASLLGGFGDLAKDKFNVLGSITFDRQDALRSEDRSFSNGYQPARGLSPDTAGTPFATQTGAAGSAIGASFRVPNDNTLYTRANLLSFQGRCAQGGPLMSQYEFALWNLPSMRYACAYDYTARRVLLQPVETASAMARATMQITPAIQGIVELVASRTEATNEFEERQITTSTAAGTFLPAYPVNGPYYQDLSQYIPTFNRNLPIAYRWRCLECGPRKIDHVDNTYRLLAGLEGAYKNWDWKTAVSMGRSDTDSTLAGGYYFSVPLRDLLASGQLNPWLMPGQTQTPQALAALQAASATGAKLVAGQTNLLQFDAGVSGDLMKLRGGSLAMAVGVDYRKEDYVFDVINSSGNVIGDIVTDTPQPKVERTVKAVYGELAIPILKALEVTLAIRHDKYSDFGDTTNPKASFAWRPVDTVMVRGSWSEGFRAPTFVQLYGLTIEGPLPGSIADPLLCPQHPNDPVYCAIRPNARTGGNANLQPETSKQWNLGFVVEPMAGVAVNVDFWEIDRKDLIIRLQPQDIINNYSQFADLVVRNPDQTINYIQAGLVNAANEITRGVDIGARVDWRAWNGRWRATIDGTYIDSYRTRILETESFRELAGQWTRRNIYPRWKHVASVTYDRAPWNVTFLQRYVHHYKDEVPPGVVPPGFDPYVEPYLVYDLTVGYTGIRNLTLRAGVKNILNEDPPFTAHATDFVSGAGWDPRIADPRGRAFVLNATYRFK